MTLIWSIIQYFVIKLEYNHDPNLEIYNITSSLSINDPKHGNSSFFNDKYTNSLRMSSSNYIILLNCAPLHMHCTWTGPTALRAYTERSGAAALRDTVTSYIIVHRSALFQSSHPSDWLWTRLDIIKTIQSRRSGCSVSACMRSVLGGRYVQWWKISGAALLIWRGCGQVLQWPGSTGVTAGWEGRGWSFLLPGVV